MFVMRMIEAVKVRRAERARRELRECERICAAAWEMQNFREARLKGALKRIKVRERAEAHKEEKYEKRVAAAVRRMEKRNRKVVR